MVIYNVGDYFGFYEVVYVVICSHGPYGFSFVLRATIYSYRASGSLSSRFFKGAGGVARNGYYRYVKGVISTQRFRVVTTGLGTVTRGKRKDVSVFIVDSVYYLVVYVVFRAVDSRVA